MGAFNVVLCPKACTKCGGDLRIQFKFGDTWQYEYQIGDHLRWGGNDNGRSGLAKVVVDGVAEVCSVCGSDNGDYEVWISHDTIAHVRRATGEWDFVAKGDTYLVVEP